MNKMDLLVETPVTLESEPRTKEEWRDLVLAKPVTAPELPTLRRYKRLAVADRVALNARRMAYHSHGILVETEAVTRISDAMIDTFLLNRAAPAGARRGMVIDGPATVGKSTLVKMVAREYELGLRNRYPERFRTLDDYIPVVFVDVPSRATPKSLSWALKDYFGLEESEAKRRGRSMEDVTAQVVKMLHRCRTSLVIVDDAHRLDCSQREGKLANDHLKHLANLCAATFVLVGIDVEAGGLFAEGGRSDRRTQTAGRFSVHRMDYLRIGTREEQVTWARTIRSFEDAYRLYRHTPGQLASTEWRYLHARSDGRMATLSDLLRRGAQQAIIDGSEEVTRKILDTLVCDQSSERAYEKATKAPTRKRTRRLSVAPTVAGSPTVAGV